MRRTEAISIATEIAQILECQAQRLSSLKTAALGKNVGFLYLKGGAIDKTDEELSQFKIHDIFIFGSVARGSDNTNDVDMILVEEGFLSKYLGTVSGMMSAQTTNGCNFDELLCVWFNLAEQDHELYSRLVRMWQDFKLDLFVLPISFFKDLEFRKELLKKHKTDFMKNAFQTLLRYSNGQWTSATLRDLENKYQVSLDDLEDPN